MHVQVYLIFIHTCSLRTVHQNNVFQVYTVHFYYQILILIYVFCKCILFTLISMLNTVYCLPMNQKTL
jgi:hypothetical protein